MKILIIYFLVILTASPFYGMADYFRASSYVGASAQTIRLGNISSFSDQAHAIYANPAMLYKLYRISGSLFTTRFMDEVTYNSMSLGARTKYGLFGFGYYSSGVTDIPKTTIAYSGSDAQSDTFSNLLTDNDYFVERIGSFGYKNTHLKLAYQFSGSRQLHMGVALNYFKEGIGIVSGSGFNIDLGMIYLTKKLEIACSLTNLLPNSTMTYSNGGKQVLPLESSYAVKYKLNDLSLLGQLRFVTSDSKLLKGFGVNYNPYFLPYIHASFGYKEVPIKRMIEDEYEDTKIGNMVVGIGLEFRGVSFDYAHEKSKHKLYNHKHYFSVSFRN